jgi:phosphopantetheinyl transferase
LKFDEVCSFKQLQFKERLFTGKINREFETMPIFFQQDIDAHTKLGVWKIEEGEDFFLSQVMPQRMVSHPHKRLQHLAGRYLLKHLFPDFPVELIRVADTRKPFLENEAFHFSISHCSDYAAVVVSRNKRTGVDIEVVTPKVERIKQKFLHPEELEIFDHDNGTETGGRRLTLLWSCKEAVFKWWSYGNVDFSEQIRLQPFELQPSGSLPALFLSGADKTELTLHYRLFPGLVLAWLAT